MSPTKYAAGFLEECEANGLPFLSTAPTGNPPIVAFKVFAAGALSSAMLEYVSIALNPGLGPKLKCNVITSAGQLFSRQDFENAISTTNGPYDASQTLYRTEESLGGYVYGTLANVQKGYYITYVIIDGVEFSSYPINQYPLAPFCLEPEVGTVALDVDNAILPARPVHILEGYNYALDYSEEDPVAVTFSVSPGAGLGVEPCDTVPAIEQVLRRINGQEANDKGEFSIQAQTADCISVDSRYINGSDPQVALNSHCAPCCRCQDYKDVSDYTKGVAVLYHKAVKRLGELVTEYNVITQRFNSRIACCQTAGSFTPRFRLWPQQNFKLQIQAMAENNTGHTIRALSMKLKHAVTAKYNMAATDENGVSYSIAQGQPIACIPISDASYLYYKNLNPTNKGLLFNIESQGVIETSVDLSSLPITSCQQEQPNDIPSCTGYLMITSGLVIVDPIFRKIVNLNASPGYVDINLTFTYFGSSPTPQGSPCGQASNRVIAENIKKTAAMAPNKKSVNPCPSATASYLLIGTDRSVRVKFSDAVHGQSSVSLLYRTFADNAWTDAGSVSIPLNLTGQYDALLGSIPSQYTGAIQVVAKYTPPPTGQPAGFVTKCKAVDASDDEVDIPAGEFETAATIII